jgi:prevent-host-death family protein
MPNPTMSELEELLGTHATHRASDVKASWREIVANARALGEVIVTNHNRPEVVVLSVERYAKLRSEAIANDPLRTHRARFDHELAVLRESGAPEQLRDAFRASPRELAAAANAAKRRRGRKK